MGFQNVSYMIEELVCASSTLWRKNPCTAEKVVPNEWWGCWALKIFRPAYRVFKLAAVPQETTKLCHFRLLLMAKIMIKFLQPVVRERDGTPMCGGWLPWLSQRLVLADFDIKCTEPHTGMQLWSFCSA